MSKRKDGYQTFLELMAKTKESILRRGGTYEDPGEITRDDWESMYAEQKLSNAELGIASKNINRQLVNSLSYDVSTAQAKALERFGRSMLETYPDEFKPNVKFSWQKIRLGTQEIPDEFWKQYKQEYYNLRLQGYRGKQANAALNTLFGFSPQ